MNYLFGGPYKISIGHRDGEIIWTVSPNEVDAMFGQEVEYVDDPIDTEKQEGTVDGYTITLYERSQLSIRPVDQALIQKVITFSLILCERPNHISWYQSIRAKPMVLNTQQNIQTVTELFEKYQYIGLMRVGQQLRVCFPKADISHIRQWYNELNEYVTIE